MKRFLVLFVLAAYFAFGAAPTTLKEVFAQELDWRITEGQLDRFAPRGALSAQPTKEPASAFLARIANGRSDSDRKLAARIAKANWSTIDGSVLKPAETLAVSDAPKLKALRSTLEKIAKSPSASASDQAELKRLLDSLR